MFSLNRLDSEPEQPAAIRATPTLTNSRSSQHNNIQHTALHSIGYTFLSAYDFMDDGRREQGRWLTRGSANVPVTPEPIPLKRPAVTF